MEEHYLDINLRRCAIIQYSNHIWKRPEMKAHLAESSVNSDIDPADTMPIALHDELDKLDLPSRIKYELKFAIERMGTIIRHFLYKMSPRKASWIDFVDYVDHIHWSHLGCINLSQTMKSLYESELLPMNYDTWLKLCDNCVEECVVDFWERVSTCDEYDELLKVICSDHVPIISKYWRFRLQNRLNKYIANIPFSDDSKTLDASMFRMSQVEPCHSFRYFWNRLNDDQKESALEECSKTCKTFGDIWNIDSWDQSVEIYMFMIQQCSLYRFEDILMSMPQSLLMLRTMSMWPWQDSFVSTVVSSCGMENRMNRVSYMISPLVQSAKLERVYVGNELKATQLFRDLWDHQEIFDEWDRKFFIEIICKTEKMEWLKYIIISEKSWERRETFLEIIVVFYRFFEKLGLLKKFLEEVSREIDTREWFVQKLFRDGGKKVVEDCQ